MTNRVLLLIIIMCAGVFFISPATSVAYNARSTHPALTNESILLYQQTATVPLSPAEIEWILWGSREETLDHSVMREFWDDAINTYQSGEKEESFLRLGQLVRLLQDQSLETNQRDQSWPLRQSFEEWAEQFDIDADLALAEQEKRAPIILPHVEEYFVSLARETQKVTRPTQNTPHAFRVYWNSVAPITVRYGAGLIDLFVKEGQKKIDTQHRQPPPSYISNIITLFKTTMTHVVGTFKRIIQNMTSPLLALGPLSTAGPTSVAQASQEESLAALSRFAHVGKEEVILPRPVIPSPSLPFAPAVFSTTDLRDLPAAPSVFATPEPEPVSKSPAKEPALAETTAPTSKVQSEQTVAAPPPPPPPAPQPEIPIVPPPPPPPPPPAPPIIIRRPRDYIPPDRPVLISPSQETTWDTADATVTLGGTMEHGATIMINGSPEQVTNSTLSSWEFLTDLVDGENIFDIIATDSAQNASEPLRVTVTKIIPEPEPEPESEPEPEPPPAAPPQEPEPDEPEPPPPPANEPPTAVTNLAITMPIESATSLTLTWSAPEDADTPREELSYSLRHATSDITDEAQWEAATIVTENIPAVTAALSEQTITVSGLSENTTYFFALRTSDGEALSPLSNIPSAATASAPPPAIIIEIQTVAFAGGAATEYVEIVNSGTTTVSLLENWTLEDAATNPHTYTFPVFSLAPNAVVRVYTGTGTDTLDSLYWGRGAGVWNDSGDTASLKDTAGILIDSFSW